MELAGGWRIRHLLLKDAEACRAGLQSCPVRGWAEDRLVLSDDLVIEDADAAGKIPLWIQDGLLRIVERHRIGGLELALVQRLQAAADDLCRLSSRKRNRIACCPHS